MIIFGAIVYILLSHFFSSMIWRGMRRVLKIERDFDDGVYALNLFIGSLVAYCWSRSVLYTILGSLTYILKFFSIALLGGLLATVAVGMMCYLSEREGRR